jgi:endonuclease/exonuclease/phosphatase (EEP) superfamily protein YafD
MIHGLLIATYSYLIGLAGWLLLHIMFGDRWWWLFLLTSLGIYLFVPLALVPLVALLGRRYELWVGFAAGVLVWGVLYGGAFFATAPVQAQEPAQARELSIMSYNMLRHNHNPEPLIAAVRAANVDVVAIQELNVPIAEALVHELGAAYPYQVLDPGVERAGMGVISRYPLVDTGDTLPGAWIGTPQILKLDFAGMQVTVFNVHTISTSLGYGGNLRIDPARIEETIREREAQVRTLVAAAEAQGGPVLAVGDFNTGDRSDAYTIATASLADAWSEAGSGLGHTFPGAATPGSSRPAVVGIRIPKWLIRIDYIFHSAHWSATDAALGPWDGVSDHRPVIARLVLE